MPLGATRRIQPGRDDPSCPGADAPKIVINSKINSAADGCRYRSGNRQPGATDGGHYLIAAFAPASSSFFLMVSASAFGIPSLTVDGAPSTRSFASFKPNPVISRRTLMTPTLLAPNSVIVTVNSV